MIGFRLTCKTVIEITGRVELFRNTPLSVFSFKSVWITPNKSKHPLLNHERNGLFSDHKDINI